MQRLNTLLATVRGTDKVFMLVQYAAKIVLHGIANKKSSLAVSIANLAAPVADTRVLLRYYGLLSMGCWISASEQKPNPNATLRLLTRLQNLANLAYYPLEHIYWLASHKIINLSNETINKVGMYSCRFWAAYVLLYFFQLNEEARVISVKRRALKNGENAQDERIVKVKSKELNSEMNILTMNAIVNAAYFPLTIHWSLEKSSFPDLGVGICGTIAALTQFYMAWKDTK